MLTVETLDKFDVRINLVDSSIVLSTYNVHGKVIGLKLVYPYLQHDMSQLKQVDGYPFNMQQINEERINNNKLGLIRKRVIRTIPR